jgi:putative ubiquitin-RnfH superfamily antitoxin RatB of RatAB toxin-antitoxin module
MEKQIINIEIVYGNVTHQVLIQLEVEAGTTIAEALQKIPEIDLSQHSVGIFGKIKALSTVLQNNDRIEIYRPLMLDPKEARRTRVKKQKHQSHKG